MYVYRHRCTYKLTYTCLRIQCKNAFSFHAFMQINFLFMQKIDFLYMYACNTHPLVCTYRKDLADKFLVRKAAHVVDVYIHEYTWHTSLHEYVYEHIFLLIIHYTHRMDFSIYFRYEGLFAIVDVVLEFQLRERHGYP